MKLHIKINKTTVVIFLCIVLLFVESWAIRMPDRPFGTEIQRDCLNNLVRVLAPITLMLSIKRKLNYIEFTIIFANLLLTVLNIFYSYQFKGVGLISLILALVYCFQTDEIRAKLFKYFKCLVVISSVVGIVCFISFHLPVVGGWIPYRIIEIEDPTVKIIDYKLCYFMYSSNYHMLRFNGFFNEPGWFGTWVAFYLCADDFNLKKKDNLVIFIAGCMTFSLAYFVLIFLYFVLKIISNIRLWPWLVIIVISYLCILPNIRTGNEAIDRLLQRMVITEDGLLVGDNRNGPIFEELYQETIHSEKIFFGWGGNYAESYLEERQAPEGLASIKSYIVNYGLIGAMALFLPILIVTLNCAIKSKNRVMLFYIIITYASLYQRPYLFWSPYLTIFICGLSYIKQNQLKQNQYESAENREMANDSARCSGMTNLSGIVWNGIWLDRGIGS